MQDDRFRFKSVLALCALWALGSTLMLAAPQRAFADDGNNGKGQNKDQKGPTDTGPTAITPEGNSLWLLSGGLLPLVAVLVWRRRRQPQG